MLDRLQEEENNTNQFQYKTSFKYLFITQSSSRQLQMQQKVDMSCQKLFQPSFTMPSNTKFISIKGGLAQNF